MGAAETPNSPCWIGAAVKRYEAELVRYAAHITGDVELARDVVQDAFLRLCRENPAELDGRMAQWLYTVCRRRALDVREKERRMKTLTDEQAAAAPSRETDQQTAAEDRDELLRVEAAVADLSNNQQEVLRLKFQGGLSYREISEITELSISNVGYLLHTALQKVREQLASQA